VLACRESPHELQPHIAESHTSTICLDESLTSLMGVVGRPAERRADHLRKEKEMTLAVIEGFLYLGLAIMRLLNAFELI